MHQQILYHLQSILLDQLKKRSKLRHIYIIRSMNTFARVTSLEPFPSGLDHLRPVTEELKKIQVLQGGAKKINPPGFVFHTLAV